MIEVMNLTREVFDATASTYDAARSKLIPCYDDFYRWAVDLIPPGAKTIVDLGAGSGLFTVLIRNRFPNAQIHAIDFSEPMLALARERLASLFGDEHHVTFHQADYTSAPLPSEACAIVSSLSIHHLEDSEKQALFRKIHAAVKPGCVFINADHVAGPTPPLEARYQSVWMKQIRAAGATEEEIAASLYRQQEDRRSPVEAQLNWMRAANFSDVDCWYKENSFAVMSGSRA
jgi:tRNA (cmo5U34)-methyltransferase